MYIDYIYPIGSGTYRYICRILYRRGSAASEKCISSSTHRVYAEQKGYRLRLSGFPEKKRVFFFSFDLSLSFMLLTCYVSYSLTLLDAVIYIVARLCELQPRSFGREKKNTNIDPVVQSYIHLKAEGM